MGPLQGPNMNPLLNLQTSFGKSDSSYNQGISVCSLRLLQTPKYSDLLFFLYVNSKLVSDKSLKCNYIILIVKYTDHLLYWASEVGGIIFSQKKSSWEQT